MTDFAKGKIEPRWRFAKSSTRYAALDKAAGETLDALKAEFPEREAEIKEVFDKAKKKNLRELVLVTGRRIDGRATEEIRPITSEVSLLPRTHGSALFTRGETQALVTATLGTKQDAQHIEGLGEEFEKTFMLHYNFPPFSTGETKPLRGASRRETGHGAPGRAGPFGGAARREDLPLHHPRGVGDPGIERLARRWPRCAAARWRSWTRACPSRRRSPASPWGSSRKATGWPCSPTSSATRITWATWTSRSAAPRPA